MKVSGDRSCDRYISSLLSIGEYGVETTLVKVCLLGSQDRSLGGSWLLVISPGRELRKGLETLDLWLKFPQLSRITAIWEGLRKKT